MNILEVLALLGFGLACVNLAMNSVKTQKNNRPVLGKRAVIFN